MKITGQLRRFLILFCAIASLWSQVVWGAGVTIVTHGFELTSFDEEHNWVEAMGDSIADRAGGTPYIYRLVITAASPTTLSATLTPQNIGLPPIEESQNAEIVIKVYWDQVAGFTPPADSTSIANLVYRTLTNFTHACELPVHLIGHSRGSSVISEIARLLGQRGIWTHQLTLLDPHPVSEFADAPVNVWETVLFADDYYEINSDFMYDTIPVPSGEYVDGTDFRFLSLSPGGYPINDGGPHSDIHLWYHGTINTIAVASDGNQVFTTTMRQNWYSPDVGQGSFSGFYYSRLGGGLTDDSGPYGGLYNEGDFNNSPDNRAALAVRNTNEWPTLIQLAHDSAGSVHAGDAFPLKYVFQSFDSSSVVLIYLDPDRNPYNGNQIVLSLTPDPNPQTATARGTRTINAGAIVPTSTPPGQYYVYGMITNPNGTRYLYSLNNIQVLSATVAAPTITSVSPATLPPSATPQTITINGTNFKGSSDPNASKLVFYDPANNPTPLRTPNFVNVGQLTYPATLPVAGTWKVKVVNGSVESQPYSFTVASGTVQLTGLSISGPANVNQNSTGQYIATAVFSDGSTPTVTPIWSLNTGAPASISTSGQLSTGSVSGNTMVTITASYTTGGITKTANYNVTISPSGNCGTTQTELVVYVNFESGNTGWIEPSGYAVITTYGNLYYSPTQYLWLGNDNATDVAYQQITFPSTATAATLSFYYNINSSVPASYGAYDTFAVTIRDTSGNILATVGNWSNLNGTTPPGYPYYQKTFDLSAYKGSTVRIYFVSNCHLAGSQTTNFRVDDVSVIASVPKPVIPVLFGVGGPTSVAEGASAQYNAIVVNCDNSVQSVTPSWSVSGPATISSSGLLTAGSVNGDTPATVTANYSGFPALNYNLSIVNVAPVFSSLAISGPSSINENSSGQFTATAIYSDSSSQPAVSPTWSVISGPGSISSSGLFSVGEISSDTVSTISASATIGAVTRSVSQQVTVVNIAIPQYTITVSAGSGGTVNPSGSVIKNAGENQTFSASPNAGYLVSQWLVDGSVVQYGGTSYTLYNVQSASAIQVTFQALSRIISINGNLGFGNVAIGTTITTNLIINNSGNSTLNISNITYPTGFSGAWSGAIAANHSTNVAVTFSPTTATNYGGAIIVNSDMTSGNNTINVSGTGVWDGNYLVVTNNNDSGLGSLREAVLYANANGGGTIAFSNVVGAITLTGGELDITTNINIVGPGPSLLAINGNGGRVLEIVSGAGSVSGLTLQNGSAFGAGIYNIGGAFSVSNCVIGGNTGYGYAGGIYNKSVLNVINCSIIGNSATGTYGGGICNQGQLSMTNCIISNNVAVTALTSGGVNNGGGIYNNGSLVLDSCTFSYNRCDGAAMGGVGWARGGSGGGLYNFSSLVMVRCNIVNNRAADGAEGGDNKPGEGGYGGGLYNVGIVILKESTLSRNSSGNGGSGARDGFSGGNGGSGGGIWNSGTLSASGCMLSSNYCGNGGRGGVYFGSACWGGDGGSGGGIWNNNVLKLTNCTAVANVCGNGGMGGNAAVFITGTNISYGGNGGDGGNGGNGGALYGTAVVNCCTIAGNAAGIGGTGGIGTTNGVAGANALGGGIFGTATVVDTLIASNTAAGVVSDVSGNFTSLGYNLIGHTNGSVGFGSSGDLVGVNPLVGTLADNGGSTLTVALLPSSPAIDAGTSTGAPSTDQRGITRPQGAGVDIGAFESVVSTAFITVTPASLDFGSIPVNTTADRLFYVTNTGSAILTGSASVATPFSIITGGGYNLAAAQGQAVTVRYSPTTVGSNNQNMIFTGGSGASRAVFGVAIVGNPLPQLTGMAMSNRLFRFALNGPAGSNYVIQVSSNLFNWRPLLTSTIPAIIIDPGASNQPRRYYRAARFAGTASGSVVAWGQDNVGQTNVPSGLASASAVAGGYQHSLALKSDGTVVGWGENDFGQTNPPVGLSNVTALAAGWGTSLALKQDGTLEEWGWDGGYGLYSGAHSLSNITAIAACWDCLLALKSDGTVVVWGKTQNGENNIPTGLSGVTAIAGGARYCMALKSDGTVVAWGDNSSGQTNIPSGLNNVTAIAAGGAHGLALKSDGTVIAWGNNSSGQTNVPVGLTGVAAIAAGNSHSVALKNDGTVVAWGDNSGGQTNVPPNLAHVSAISAGGFHNLVITSP
jgi:hypothetical protein